MGDFKKRVEDEARMKEREEKKLQAGVRVPMAGPVRYPEPQNRIQEQQILRLRALEERDRREQLVTQQRLVMASALAQVKDAQRPDTSRIRAQCPSCRSVNDVLAV